MQSLPFCSKKQIPNFWHFNIPTKTTQYVIPKHTKKDLKSSKNQSSLTNPWKRPHPLQFRIWIRWLFVSSVRPDQCRTAFFGIMLLKTGLWLRLKGYKNHPKFAKPRKLLENPWKSTITKWSKVRKTSEIPWKLLYRKPLGKRFKKNTNWQKRGPNPLPFPLAPCWTSLLKRWIFPRSMALAKPRNLATPRTNSSADKRPSLVSRPLGERREACPSVAKIGLRGTPQMFRQSERENHSTSVKEMLWKNQLREASY